MLLRGSSAGGPRLRSATSPWADRSTPRCVSIDPPRGGRASARWTSRTSGRPTRPRKAGAPRRILRILRRRRQGVRGFRATRRRRARDRYPGPEFRLIGFHDEPLAAAEYARRAGHHHPRGMDGGARALPAHRQRLVHRRHCFRQARDRHAERLVEHYFSQLGDIGTSATPRRRCSRPWPPSPASFPPERYRAQCANLARARYRFAPAMLAGRSGASPPSRPPFPRSRRARPRRGHRGMARARPPGPPPAGCAGPACDLDRAPFAARRGSAACCSSFQGSHRRHRRRRALRRRSRRNRSGRAEPSSSSTASRSTRPSTSGLRFDHPRLLQRRPRRFDLDRFLARHPGWREAP